MNENFKHVVDKIILHEAEKFNVRNETHEHENIDIVVDENELCDMDELILDNFFYVSVWLKANSKIYTISIF